MIYLYLNLWIKEENAGNLVDWKYFNNEFFYLISMKMFVSTQLHNHNNKRIWIIE